MDIRPVYWALFGAGATLLTSAWGSKQAVLLPPNQDAKNVAATMAKEAVGLSQVAANNILLMKRQPWTEAKSDPFSKAAPVKQKTTVPIVGKVEIPSPQPPSFPYVFVGRLLAEEKEAVFLSKNNQVYTVVAGDILEGTYRIERVGSNELEIVYLPDRQKSTISFDALALKPVPRAGTLLSQAETPSGNVFPATVLPVGMASGVPGNNNGQTGSLNQTLISPIHSQAGAPDTAGASPPPVPPAEMAGEAPSESNGLMTDDLRQMLAPPPPPEGDVLKMMGSTPPPQGNAMQIMEAPSAQGGQTLPGAAAAPAAH